MYLRLAGREQNQIRRNLLAVPHLDNVPNPNIPPADLFKARRSKDEHTAIIDVAIGEAAFGVLENLLTRRDKKDERQRHQGGPTAGGRHVRYLLEASDKEEEGVAVAAKTLKQEERKEGQRVVLGGADGVGGEPGHLHQLVGLDDAADGGGCGRGGRGWQQERRTF